MKRLRIAVDMPVGDDLTTNDYENIKDHFIKYTEGVVAELVLETEIGKPNITLHFHESTGDYACEACRNLSRDGLK